MERPFDSACEPDGSQLQCRICFRPFKRSGHLRRHERTHTAARPFQCTQCRRTFTRRDALQRHANSHLDVPNLVQQGSRACTLCASAKTRCSGELPCKRCSDRGFTCTYPSRDFSATDQLAASELDGVAAPKDAAPLLPQDVVGLHALSNPSPDDLMPDADAYPYHDWDDGFFNETNWLEAPIGPDVNLSPLSWIFGPYTQTAAHLDDTSPSQIASTETQFGIDREHGLGEDEGQRAASSSSPARDHPSGEYYVDGEPARLPRVRRRIDAATRARQAQAAWSGIFSLHIPDTTVFPDTENTFEIFDANYRIIFDLYHRLCRLDGPFGASFTDHELPSKSVFEALAAQFCDKFNNVLPFLHWTTLSNSGSRNYVLDLAIVAVGSQFLGNANFSIALHEFTRRCLIIVSEELETSIEKEISLAAALLLNVVGLAYCGDDRLHQQALQARGQVKARFERLRHQVESSSVDSIVDSLPTKWQGWIQRESSTRLMFSMWLVDTMLVAHYQATPIFYLESVTFPLPSGDEMWQCREMEAWDMLYKAQQRQSTLMELLQQLYYNKSFPTVQTDEFVRILTIHGLFHRLWEVERYYSGTLSQWEPSSARLSGALPFPKAAPWLPAVPAFKNWQNASCDALDVLHWQANSTIGQMRGLEHPTVGHLHFARIVLLCPCSDILALARHLASTNVVAASREDVNKATNTVRRWAVHHQYKARLAAIHAGVTLWHIRRHGIDAFYEPPALGLAALVLWAFAMFADGQPSRSRAHSVPRDSGEGVMPSAVAETAGTDANVPVKDFSSHSEDGDIILLDRPTDDELVQQFIRDGASMRPFMSGIGEVFAPHAPRRILDKCIDLLRNQGCWGTAVEWMKLLQSLRASRRLDSRPP